MAKYRLLRDRLVLDPLHADDVFLEPPAATRDELCTAHDADYVDRVMAGALSEAELKRIGFPWTDAMVERSRRSSGATLAAARTALAGEKLAVNLAGGTHHAMRGAGEGYCVFNDAAVTIRTLLSEKRIGRACVIDCDVHQGNGTAEIMGNDLDVFTFSIHCAKNFPVRKFPSHLDVDLDEGTRDDEYLTHLERALHLVLSRGPYDLAIYLAGADPFEGDRLGKLGLTKDGLILRDRMVLEYLMRAGVPTAVAMAGGYAPDVQDIVDIHAGTIAECKRVCT
ncbi:MAG: histone deacetylase [Pirellula sp.]|nr:histone deacetylase [Pirellula sp.]